MFAPDTPIEITDQLYLGNFNSATYSNLARKNIGAVVCLTKVAQKYDQNQDKIRMLHIDSISEELVEDTFTLDKLLLAVDFIEQEIAGGCNVLVHCKAGASRSPTVVIAYIMKKNGWSINESIAFVEKKAMHINPTFIKLLQDFSEHLL